MIAPAAALLTVLTILITLPLVAACSTNPKGTAGGDAGDPGDVPRAPRGGQGTLGESTGSVPPPEATLHAGPRPPGVLLRLEGDPATTLSGTCSLGAWEQVLSGEVPKRFAFDPNGRQLSCRIRRPGTGGGDLKVILTADGTVRSS